MSDLVVMMSVEKAQKVTDEIGKAAFTMAMAYDRLVVLVEQAKTGNAHLALGFTSWTAYLADAVNKGLDGAPLTTDVRREVVAYLSGEGMSTRAIASVVGAGKSTVDRDLAQVSHCGTPDDDVVRQGDVLDDRRVVGLDGKRYVAHRQDPPKERRAPRRIPLIESIKWDLYKIERLVAKLERDTLDDRFRTLREDDRIRQKNHLARLQKTLFECRQRLGGDS